MKIEQVDVYVVRLNQHYRVAGHTDMPGRLPGTDYYVEPQWSHAYSGVLESCLVKVTTADGTTGWGEAQAPLSPQTPAALITTLLGPALLGENALATTVLFDRMYALMLARGHTGSFLLDAMAGLDIALWDVKGRRHGAPIGELLGGPRRAVLPGYITGLRVTGLPQKVELARRLRQAGFAGVKLVSGGSAGEIAAEVEAVRGALGDDAFLALDAICKYDLGTARRIGRVLDAQRTAWFEAPLAMEDVAGHAALAEAIDTPIAIGETLRTPRQFAPWLECRALAVAQPDIMRTGMTGAWRIANLAAVHHVPTTLHTGICTGIGMAATWQLASVLVSDLPQEHQHDLFGTACSILKEPLHAAGGALTVPVQPGLGVAVDEQAVLALTTEHWIVDRNGRRRAG